MCRTASHRALRLPQLKVLLPRPDRHQETTPQAQEEARTEEVVVGGASTAEQTLVVVTTLMDVTVPVRPPLSKATPGMTNLIEINLVINLVRDSNRTTTSLQMLRAGVGTPRGVEGGVGVGEGALGEVMGRPPGKLRLRRTRRSQKTENDLCASFARKNSFISPSASATTLEGDKRFLLLDTLGSFSGVIPMGCYCDARVVGYCSWAFVYPNNFALLRVRYLY